MTMGQLLAATVIVTKPRVVFECLAHVFQWFVVHLIMLAMGFSLPPIIFFACFAIIEFVFFVVLGGCGDRCIPKDYQLWKQHKMLQGVNEYRGAQSAAVPTMGTTSPTEDSNFVITPRAPRESIIAAATTRLSESNDKCDAEPDTSGTSNVVIKLG